MIKNNFGMFDLCGALSGVPGTTSPASPWVFTPNGSTAKRVMNQIQINVAIATHPRIGFLACTEPRIRQRVLPAEIIPVIHRQAERDHVGIVCKVAENLVGRRT